MNTKCEHHVYLLVTGAQSAGGKLAARLQRCTDTVADLPFLKVINLKVFKCNLVH